MTASVSRPAKRLRRTATMAPAPSPTSPAAAARHFAIVGAGMAGVACARTLVQAGHRVSVFEKSQQAGGRTTTLDSPFGSFDAGAQYFTVRDPRFAQAMETTPGICRPWSASTVRILDAQGRVAAAGLATREPHWVASPGMDALVHAWAAPLQHSGQLITNTRVASIERDPLDNTHWQLRTEAAGGAQHVYAGFDAVLLAQPATPARDLLAASGLNTPLGDALGRVTTAPCWTLMVAFPHAVRPGLTTLGPQWNAARSTHHRIAWLARESSKPGRTTVERWTVQASPAWSAEHLEDDEDRVQAKLLKAFAEVTGIHAEPAHADTRRWRYAQTMQPLGQTHLWDDTLALGACGDWCLGHRLEDAFVSGLELALAVA